MFKCSLLWCDAKFSTVRGYVAHCSSAHKFEKNLKARCFSCTSGTFKSGDSLRKHFQNFHRDEWGAPQHREPERLSQQSQQQREPGGFHEQSEDNEQGAHDFGSVEVMDTEADGNEEEQAVRTPQGAAVSTFNDLMNTVRGEIPALFLRMQYKYGLPMSVARQVHSEYIDVIRYLRSKWSSSLHNYTAPHGINDPDFNTILTCGDLDEICHTSTHKERAQLQVLGWVEPIEVFFEDELKDVPVAFNPLTAVELDEDDVEAVAAAAEEAEDEEEAPVDPLHTDSQASATNDTNTEGPNSSAPRAGSLKEGYHYIPLLESLKSYLRHDDVLDAVLRGGSQHQGDGYYDCFTSGAIYKRSSVLSLDPYHLRITIYTDEITVTNPLASHSRKHKLAVVYYIVGNVHPKYQSALKSIHLVAISKWKLIQKHGYNVFLNRLIVDLEKLNQEGIDVTTFSGRTMHFTGSVSNIAADNLSAHALGGFRCCFSSGKFCRFCLVDFKDRRNVNCSVQAPLRTENSVEYHSFLVGQDPALAAVFGIVSRSCLYRLAGFNPLRCLAPDVMHDILECFLPSHLREIILYLHRKKIVSFGTTKRLLAEFKYGKSDGANRFPGFPDEWLKSKKKNLGGTAAEKWCFFRLFPLMVGHLVPEDDENWKLFKIALRIAGIVLALKTSNQMVCELVELIDEHHKLWVVLYPHVFPAKFHYLTHYPKLILEFGPLRLLWCMRFESFHQRLKTALVRCRNFKNPTKTASHRVQKGKALEYADAVGLPPQLKVTSARRPTVLSSVLPTSAQAALMNAFGCTDTSFVDVLSSVFVGFPVHTGAHFIVHLHCDVVPVFFRTETIYLYEETVALYGCLVGSGVYNAHLEAYCVPEGDEENNVVITVKDIISPQCLDPYVVSGSKYVRFRFRPL